MFRTANGIGGRAIRCAEPLDLTKPDSRSRGSHQISPSRTSQTDQALAQCIWRSIADYDDRDSAQASGYPHPGWRACTRSSGEAYADELGTVASLLYQSKYPNPVSKLENSA